MAANPVSKMRVRARRLPTPARQLTLVGFASDRRYAAFTPFGLPAHATAASRSS